MQVDATVDDSFKVVLVGGVAVGKTSLVQRFTEAASDATSETSAVAEPKTKDLGVVFSGQAKRIRVTVCETGVAGTITSQEMPLETHLQGAHGVAFVFDISREETLTEVEKRLQECDAFFGSKPYVKLLVAAKTDLSRAVSQQTAEVWAASHDMTYVETSALKDEGVQSMFDTFVQKMLGSAVSPRQSPRRSFSPRASLTSMPSLSAFEVPDEEEDEHAPDHLLKCVVVGDPAVGKSSLLRSWATPTTTDRETDAPTTADVTYRGKTLVITTLEGVEKVVKLTAWDTPSGDRAPMVIRNQYRNAHAVIFVCDVTKPESLQNLSSWQREMEVYSRNSGKDLVKIVAANKFDLHGAVTTQVGNQWATEHGMLYTETSATTQEGVDELFKFIASEALQRPMLLVNTAPRVTAGAHAVLEIAHNARRYAVALAKGKRKWGRCKLNIIGESGAGKTALTKTLAGQESNAHGDVLMMADVPGDLQIALCDFRSDQTMLDSMQHLFFNRSDVYALVFNLEWLVSDGPDRDKALSYMRKWLSSIAAHTYDQASETTAPIVLVGTRVDLVSDPVMHAQISLLLEGALSSHIAWRSVMQRKSFDANSQSLVFFPVGSQDGKGSPSLKHLMFKVRSAAARAEYTNKEVPLTWLKAIDQMSDTKKDSLPLSEVITMLGDCGLSRAEVPLVLSFLHDMGYLMWLDERGLRDVVILDPMSYLVAPTSAIINEVAPHAVGEVPHHECEQTHRKEWALLVDRGVLSVTLLPILWKQYQPAHTAMLLKLMVKFGLIVPMPAIGNSDTTQYLVPELLPPTPERMLTAHKWCDGQVTTCYFVFTLEADLQRSPAHSDISLQANGYLSVGLFERIVGAALDQVEGGFSAKGSSKTTSDRTVVLHQDLAVLTVGQQRVRLVHCADIHSVRVEVEGEDCLTVERALTAIIASVTAACVPALCAFVVVPYPPQRQDDPARSPRLGQQQLQGDLLIPMERLRCAVKGKTDLMLGGQRILTVSAIERDYGAWVKQSEGGGF